MPVLTKINTNVIADDAITGAKFAGDTYLENTATQNLTGTYAESRLYTSDAYTLTGDTTVNANLVLSSVKGDDSDITLTADSTTRTLTGTGVLSGGGTLHGRNTVTGMTGELGSAVTGSPNLNLTTGTLGSGVTGGSGLTALGTVTAGNLSNTAIVYPAGHIIKIETMKGSGNHDLSGVTGMTATGLKDSITFTAGNKILVIASIQVASWLGGTDTGTQLKLRDNTNGVDLSPSQYMYAASGGSPETDIEGPMTLVPELYAPSGTTIEIELYHENPWSGGGAGTPVARVTKSRSTLQLMEVQA